MSIAIQNNMIFAPMMIKDVLTALKDKAVDIKDKTIFNSMYKILDIARADTANDAKEINNDLENISIEDIATIEFTQAFETLEYLKDNLMSLEELYANSDNAYEIQLYEIVDETLDNVWQIINAFMYLNSKLAKYKLQAS